jgi:hypothetical protein
MNYRSIADINAFVKRNNLLGVKQCLAENPDCINNIDAEGLTPLHCMASISFFHFIFPFLFHTKRGST